MKNLFAAGLAVAMGVSLAMSGAALAHQGGGDDHGHQSGPGGMGHPGGGPGNGPGRWHNGGHYSGNRHVADWRHYHLRQPPQGYEWVQDSNQFVLIGIGSGIILDIH